MMYRSHLLLVLIKDFFVTNNQYRNTWRDLSTSLYTHEILQYLGVIKLILLSTLWILFSLDVWLKYSDSHNECIKYTGHNFDTLNTMELPSSFKI